VDGENVEELWAWNPNPFGPDDLVSEPNLVLHGDDVSGADTDYVRAKYCCQPLDKCSRSLYTACILALPMYVYSIVDINATYVAWHDTQWQYLDGPQLSYDAPHHSLHYMIFCRKNSIS